MEGIQLNISWVVFYACDTSVFSLLVSTEIFLNKLLFVLSLKSFGIIGDKDCQGDINKTWSLQIWRGRGKDVFVHSCERAMVR